MATVTPGAAFCSEPTLFGFVVSAIDELSIGFSAMRVTCAFVQGEHSSRVTVQRSLWDAEAQPVELIGVSP